MATDDSLTSRALHGVSWSTVARVGQTLISFGSMAILARLLPPSAYGLMGMATMFTALLEQIKDLGMTYSIIQADEITDEFLSSVFWANCALGVISMAIVIALSVPAGLFFGEPTVTRILPVLSISFLVTSANVVHPALMSRQMQFKRLCIAELAAAIIASTVGIAFALYGAGAWSLVAAAITSASANLLLNWVLHPWKPRLHYQWKDIKSIASYSMNMSAFTLVNYAARNMDNLIIGRVLGKGPLGLYAMAYNLMLYPIGAINQIAGRVLFSVYSKIQNDRPRLQAAYLRTAGAMAAISFPVMIGAMVTADCFIPLLLGDKWIAAVPVFIVLAPVGVLQSLTSPTGNLFMATGRPDLLFRVGLLGTGTVIVAFLIGVQWGISGVATAYLIAVVALTYPILGTAFSLIDLPMGRFVREVGPVLAVAVAMAGLCILWRKLLYTWALVELWTHLVSTVVIGAISYILLLRRWLPVGVAESLGHVVIRFPTPAIRRSIELFAGRKMA